MAQKINIGPLSVLCSSAGGTEKIAYILYPMDMLDGWIDSASKRYGTAIAVVTGMDWDNVFSPWPAPGQPPGCPAFKGEAAGFLKTLQQAVIPAVEQAMGIAPGAERTLVGVSMSGLFAMWQWLVCDTFANISSLSGSFWYDGFADWVKAQPAPRKTGKAFFLLGDQESKSRVKAFRSVAADTAEIIGWLRQQGVNAVFQSVPGDHFADPVGRLDTAFAEEGRG